MSKYDDLKRDYPDVAAMLEAIRQYRLHWNPLVNMREMRFWRERAERLRELMKEEDSAPPASEG